MEKTKKDRDLERAYGLAHKMSKRFVETHPRPVYHLDEDDYAQEAIIAWLEKKHIPFRLVDTYRKAAPISRRDWAKKGKELKLYDPVNIDLISDAMLDSQDVEEDADKLMKLKAIQKVVNDLIDPRQQIIIIMKYTKDMSLTEIARGLGISKAYASRLHRECLAHIKKEVEKYADMV